MIKKKVKTTSAPQTETRILENETLEMENKLLIMKEFIKNVRNFKTFDEKSIKNLIQNNIVAKTTQKSHAFKKKTIIVQPKTIAKTELETSTQIKNVIEIQKSPRLSKIILEYPEIEAFSSEQMCFDKIETHLEKDSQKLKRFYDICKINNLENDLKKAGINNFYDLSHATEDIFNFVYITANKQDMISNAINQIENKEVDHPREIHIQTDSLPENELPEKVEKLLKTHFSDENEKKCPTIINSSSIFGKGVFDFSDFFTNFEQNETKIKKMKINVTKVFVCENCFRSFFFPEVLNETTELKMHFCSSQCQKSNQEKSEKKELLKKSLVLNDPILEQIAENNEDSPNQSIEIEKQELEEYDLNFGCSDF